MNEPKGLAHLVATSGVVHCKSRQHGHQLPITDCDCEICRKVNLDAWALGIEDRIWRPTEDVRRETANILMQIMDDAPSDHTALKQLDKYAQQLKTTGTYSKGD